MQLRWFVSFVNDPDLLFSKQIRIHTIFQIQFQAISYIFFFIFTIRHLPYSSICSICSNLSIYSLSSIYPFLPFLPFLPFFHFFFHFFHFVKLFHFCPYIPIFNIVSRKRLRFSILFLVCRRPNFSFSILQSSFP